MAFNLPELFFFLFSSFFVIIIMIFFMFYFIRLHGTDLISKALSVGARPTACPMKKRPQSKLLGFRRDE